MRHQQILIICFIGLFSCVTKTHKFKSNYETVVLNSKIKTKKLYSYAENRFDTLDVNSEVAYLGIPKYIYHYGLDGKLEKEFLNINDTSHIQITFYYDENNLISKKIKDSNGRIKKEYLYQYNNNNTKELELINDKKFTLTKLNEFGGAIERFYFNEVGGVEKTINYHYKNDKLVMKMTSRGDSLKGKVTYRHDKEGRIIVKQFFDRNEDLIRKINFIYLHDDSIKVLEYDKDNILKKESKKIKFKDENQNLIKEYFFRYENKTTTITEFKIEYY